MYNILIQGICLTENRNPRNSESSGFQQQFPRNRMLKMWPKPTTFWWGENLFGIYNDLPALTYFIKQPEAKGPLWRRKLQLSIGQLGVCSADRSA